jgi:hypothetical protein
VQRQFDSHGPSLAIPREPRPAAGEGGRQHDDCGSQADRQPAPRLFLDRLSHGLHTRQLGPLQPFLHSAQISSQVRDDLGSLARPVTRQGGQTAPGEVDQLVIGPTGIQPAPGPTDISAGRHVADIASRSSGVRRFPGENLAEDGAQSKHVDTFVEPVGLSAGLFRGHVGGCTQHRPGPRGIGRTAVTDRQHGVVKTTPLCGSIGCAGCPQNFGQAPIHDLYLAEAADHDVARLQVAVDYAPRMGIGHGLANLLEDAQEMRPVLVRLRALRQERGQRATVDQLHREVRPSVRRSAQLVDWDDAGVLELAADLSLFDEALD